MTQRVFTYIGVFHNKTEKVVRNLRTNLNTFTEWKAKKEKRKNYFSHYRVHIRDLVLLSVLEEYLLPFPLSGREWLVGQGT